MNRERQSPGNLFFLLAAKERTKENCRCFDAARGCARGATVERSETGERTMIAPAGQSTARACLRSKLAALVVRRQAPPNPRRGKGRPPCQRGLSPLGDWGIPTGFAWPPVTPADGQESLRLACARHLPLTREAFLAGSARAKGSPLRGELAAPAGLRGFAGLSAAASSPLCRQIHS